MDQDLHVNMAFTATQADRFHKAGKLTFKTFDLDITSYTNGGEPVTAADFGLRRLDAVMGLGAVVSAGTTFTWEFDESAGTILAYQVSDGFEASDTTDVGSQRVVVVGI